MHVLDRDVDNSCVLIHFLQSDICSQIIMIANKKQLQMRNNVKFNDDE